MPDELRNKLWNNEWKCAPQPTDYGSQNVSTMTLGGYQGAAEKLSDPPAPPLPPWAPPIITEPYGQPRVATQADIDRLIKVERLYNTLMYDIRAHIKHVDGGE